MVIFHSYVAVYQRVTCLPTVKLFLPLEAPSDFSVSHQWMSWCDLHHLVPYLRPAKGVGWHIPQEHLSDTTKKRSFGGITETVSFGLVNVCWCWGLRGVHIHHIPGKFHSIKRSQPLVAPAPPALFRHDAYLRAHSNRWHIDDMLSHISLLLYIV